MTGKSKPPILRAIRRGQISATRDDAGAFRIDVAELHRAFPPLGSEADRDPAGDTARRDDLRQHLRDELFSDNPPLSEMVRPDSVGDESLPEEIRLIRSTHRLGCGAGPAR